MAIEMTPGVQAPSSATTPSPTRGKPASVDGTGSFGTVLASVDDEGQCDAAVSATQDAPPSKGKQTAREADPVAVPGIAPVAEAPVDPSAMLLAQGALTGAATMPARESMANPATAKAQSRGSVAGIGDSIRETAFRGMAAAFNAGVDASGRNGVGASGLAHDAALGSSLSAAASATATSGATATALAAAKAADVDSTAAMQFSPLASATAAVPVETATRVASEWASTWQRVDRERGQASTHASPTAGLDGTTPAQPLIAPPDAAGATASGAGAGMMERMVEQVSWWMAQGHQGAELKLELPGGAPVSVSVQVQGNEAHVAFRSDHPAARQWLGDAMPQLRQMLGNEGLMLSGASVGDSGADARQEAGRHAQRVPDAGGGRGAVTTVEAPAVSATRPRSMAERSLDLYV